MARHYKTLDAMRGIAALAVLTLHICKLFGLVYLPLYAHMAVDFFFMLSGFVIAQAYEDRLMAGWLFVAFVRKRVIRLYPMVLVGASAGLVLLAMRHLTYGDISWRGVALVAAPNLLLVPSPALLSFRPFGFLLNSPFWSLSSEMALNLAYAAGVLWLSTRRLVLLIVAGAAALIAVSIIHGGIDVGFDWDDYGLGIVRAVFPFFAGVAIHRYVTLQVSSERLNLPVVAVLAALLFSPWAFDARYEALLVVLLFPALVIVGACAAPSKRLDALWKGLGELSYPLYAVHYPIVAAMAQISKAKHLTGAAQIGLGLACAGLVVAVASGALVLFDRPVRLWLERVVPKTRGEAARSAAGKPASVPLS